MTTLRSRTTSKKSKKSEVEVKEMIIPKELIGKKLSKTRIKLLNRPMRASEMRQEVMEELVITSCLMCSRPFRAVSRINKICSGCKQTDKWKDF